MKPLTAQVHELLAEHLLAGETVIDATAGNGHDTLFLAERVGKTGKVFAIDVQPAAIHQTETHLERAGWKNMETVIGSHAEMLQLLPDGLVGKIAAITFNLGYLPGGDQTKTTSIVSTKQAIIAAGKLLKPGGIITILAYTGHPGGAEEAEAVLQIGQQLSTSGLQLEEHNAPPSNSNSPRFFVIHKIK